MAGTLPGAEDSAENQTDKFPAFMETDDKQSKKETLLLSI